MSAWRLPLRLALAGIFVYASVDKIFHPTDFAILIHGYRLLPSHLVTLVAVTLPWVELVGGGLLAIGLLAEGSALVLGGLSFVFAGAVGSALARGIDLACGCFSTSPDQASAGWEHVALNLALAGAAAVLATGGPGPLALERRPEVGAATDLA